MQVAIPLPSSGWSEQVHKRTLTDVGRCNLLRDGCSGSSGHLHLVGGMAHCGSGPNAAPLDHRVQGVVTEGLPRVELYLHVPRAEPLLHSADRA